LALLDLGVDPSILRNAISLLLKGDQDCETSLMDALQRSVTSQNIHLSQLHQPIMNDPRTMDRYLSALELTINTRMHLRERAKVVHFWKMLAKANPANTNVVTPSASQLDQLQEYGDPSMTPSKSFIVDTLVGKLRDALMHHRSDVGDSNGSNSDDNRSTVHETQFRTSAASSSLSHSRQINSKQSVNAFYSRVSYLPRWVPSRAQVSSSSISIANAREPVCHEALVTHRSMQSLSVRSALPSPLKLYTYDSVP